MPSQDYVGRHLSRENFNCAGNHSLLGRYTRSRGVRGSIDYNQRFLIVDIFISTSRQTHLQIQYNILTNRKSLCKVKYCCGEEREFPHPLIINETIFTRNTEVTEGKYKCQIEYNYIQHDENGISKRIPADTI